MSYRLPGTAAPATATEILVSQAAFKRWMGTVMGYEAMPADNPGQECYYIAKKDGMVNGTPDVLNCHITAMLRHRDAGPCRNFHFKIQMGKSSSHYWHYKLYRNTAGNFLWGADVNAATGTNQAGGGAGDDIDKVRLNLLDVEKDCAKYGFKVEDYMNNGTLSGTLKKLKDNMHKFHLDGANLV